MCVWCASVTRENRCDRCVIWLIHLCWICGLNVYWWRFFFAVVALGLLMFLFGFGFQFTIYFKCCAHYGQQIWHLTLPIDKSIKYMVYTIIISFCLFHFEDVIYRYGICVQHAQPNEIRNNFSNKNWIICFVVAVVVFCGRVVVYKIPIVHAICVRWIVFGCSETIVLNCNKLQVNYRMKIHFSKFNSINPWRSIYRRFKRKMGNGTRGGQGS